MSDNNWSSDVVPLDAFQPPVPQGWVQKELLQRGLRTSKLAKKSRQSSQEIFSFLNLLARTSGPGESQKVGSPPRHLQQVYGQCLEFFSQTLGNLSHTVLSVLNVLGRKHSLCFPSFGGYIRIDVQCIC